MISVDCLIRSIPKVKLEQLERYYRFQGSLDSRVWGCITHPCGTKYHLLSKQPEGSIFFCIVESKGMPLHVEEVDMQEVVNLAYEGGAIPSYETYLKPDYGHKFIQKIEFRRQCFEDES